MDTLGRIIGYSETILPTRRSERGVIVPENGVIGNYDPLQSEHADNVTLREVQSQLFG